MITFEQMNEALTDPIIQELDVSAFSQTDIVNIILQRSEIIRDQNRPGKAVSAWMEGDSKPALAMVDALGEELVRRAAAFILLEYREIKPAIDQIEPKRVADIGCGYAIFDLFLWHDHKVDLLLVDLEQTDERHFGYRETGSAYSNLDVARKFLEANGVATDAITCLNPEQQDIMETEPVDLAVSFISCGFHYPVDLYLDYFRTHVATGGGVILDFRARKAREGMSRLNAFGETRILTDAAYGNARRVEMRKAPA